MLAAALTCLVQLWAQAPSAPALPRLAVSTEPQRITVEKAFLHACPAVQVTADRAAADYLFSLEHQVWSLDHWKHDRWDLTRGNGDVIAGGSATTLGRAVKAACAAIAGGAHPDKKLARR